MAMEMNSNRGALASLADVADSAESRPSSSGADFESGQMAALLTHIEREAHVSQRRLAGELGVALGLINAYVKRCVKKGLIKIQQVPPRRYAYYLTPKGFAEKSRLTAEFLSWSLSFFRQARVQCTALFDLVRERNWQDVALWGGSDLMEIAILCASEQGVSVVAIVDAGMQKTMIFNIPVVATLDAVARRPDGVIVTGIRGAQDCYDRAVAAVGAERVLVPALLSVRVKGARS
jgi:DNA-binding MarR family transcriptional regulator